MSLMVTIPVTSLSAEDAPMPRSIAKTYVDSKLGTMPYRVFFPDGYSEKSDAVPAILFLHGAGERGTDNRAQANSQLAPLLSVIKSKYKAIVVAPQCAPGNQWAAINQGDQWNVGAYHLPDGKMSEMTKSLQMAMNLFDQVVASNRVDPHRLYVTGLSMGGYGTWEVIARFPKKFAAAAPLSGGGCLDSVNAIKNVPIWAYHGIGDNIVPDTGTTEMIKALHAVGSEAYASLIGGKGHMGWSEFYTDHSTKQTFGWYNWDTENGQFFYPWLFSQKTAD